MRLHAIRKLKSAALILTTLLVGLSPLGGVASVALQTASADAAPCTISSTLVNSCRPWLGNTARNYTDAPKTTNVNTIDQVLWQETRMGRQNDMVHTYHPVGDNQLSSTDLYFARRAGTMLFTDWNPVANWGDIATQNAAIDSMAASINQLGNAKVFLTLWHEPENDVSPGGDSNCPNVIYKGTSGTVQQYKDMWTYTENRFAADGVHNVVWVMDYMNYPTWDCLVPDMYPGNQTEIDWIMYNAYTTLTATSQPNLNSVVDRFHNLLTSKGMVGQPGSPAEGIVEWGITGPTNSSTTTSREMTYYDQAKAMVENSAYNYLKAYMYFDEQDQGLATGTNFRVGYDDNGTKDTAKGAHYYSFANDAPLLNSSYGPLLDTVAPSTPTGLGATATGTHSINLSWQPSVDYGGVTSYTIYRDGTSIATIPAPTQPVTAVTPVAVTYTDSAAPDGATHQYTVAASDAAGNPSTQSAGASVSLADVTTPDAPTGLAATTPSQTEVDLTWSAPTDNVGVAGYNVYRGGTKLTAQPITTATYQDLGRSVNTAYSYTVSALDAAGNESAQSTPLNVTTPGAPDTTAPSVPTGVNASTTTVGEIDVTWQAASDDTAVTGYHVYRSDNPSTALATVTTGTSYQDLTVASNTTYTYTVSAFDAAGNESAQSAGATVTSLQAPDITPPSAPANLTATVAGTNEIDLTWDASTDDRGVTGYNVYRDGHFVTIVFGTTYADTNANDGITYTYTIKAFDAANNTSGPSNAASAATPDVTAPTAPSNLIAVLGGGSAQLSWQAATDNVGVTGYNIYRSDSPNIAIATVLGTSFTNTGLTDATNYTYTVTAVDAAGHESVASNAATITTTDTTPPTTPIGVTAAAAGANVTVQWQASTDNVGVAGYYVYRSNTPNQPIATVTSGTSYLDTGLAEASQYTYTVVAFDATSNTSARSDGATVTIPDLTAPTAPTGLTAAPTSSSQIALSWNAATDNVGVTSYTVYRDGGAVANVIGTSYSDTGLAEVSSHTYTVIALDAAQNPSVPSNTATATTLDVTPPSVPLSVMATANANGTTVTVQWQAATDNVGVAGYKVYYSTDLAHPIATVTTGTSYSDTGLTSGNTYRYVVAAYDAANNQSAQSAVATATTPDVIAPNIPSGVAATAVDGHHITVSWTAATDNIGVTGYYVYRNDVPGNSIATVTSGTSYSDTVPTDATTYVYTVRAFDAAGNVSAPSQPASATTPDVTAPSVPLSVTATAGVNGTTVTVQWAASTDNSGTVTGYKLYRNGTFVTNVTTGTSYGDTGLTSGITYTYTVKSYDAANNLSAASAVANATTPDVVAPSVPTVTATPVNGHQINLSWNASTDNVGTTGYKLYRNGTFVTNVTTGTSYGDTGLTDATTYSYTVAAYDAAGNTSAQSAPAAAATPDVTAPNVPTGLGATAVSSSQINLSWAAPTDNVGVTGYKVYRSGILLTTVTGTSYSNTGLTASTQYTYTVAAYDAANNLGAQSTSATATTQAAAPTQWVTNPSLETDTTGWGKYNTSSSVTRFQVPGGSYDGQWALKIAPTSGTTAGTNNGNGSPIWVSSSVAGKTYTGSAQVRAGTAGEQVRLAIVEYSGSNVVGSYTSPVLPLNDITSWHSISAAYTAQNSGDVIKYSLYVSNFTSTSQYFLADMLSLTSPN